jgi:hypothetical protein
MDTPNFQTNDPNQYLPDDEVTHHTAHSVSITCPHCGHVGTFHHLSNIQDVFFRKKGQVRTQSGAMTGANVGFHAGIRRCPNPLCGGLVSVLAFNNSNRLEIIDTHPPQLISFRTDNIPANIVSSIKEAIACHAAQAYRAAALMVRRSLELLCEEKGASGANLQQRIRSLAQFAILPPALLSGADNLRLLGNDAAHVEAKSYDDIDKQHSELAIEVCREVLKAVYQHDDLVARLAKLKK